MNKIPARISADEYFLKIASVVAERSTCLRHHMGAVAVKDKHILTTGRMLSFRPRCTASASKAVLSTARIPLASSVPR